MAFIYAHQLYLSGSMDVHSGSFIGAIDPTQETELTNKRYVDALVDLVISGSDRFVGLKDTISSFSQYRLLYQSTGSVVDSANLLFNTDNTFEVGGDIIIRPKSAGNYPKLYFYNTPSGSRFHIETYSSGDIAFKSGSSDVFYFGNSFIRSIKNFQVTGSAHFEKQLYVGTGSILYENTNEHLRTDTNFSVGQEFGIGLNDEVKFYYSSSGVSPTKTVFLLAKMENNEEVIVSSRII